MLVGVITLAGSLTISRGQDRPIGRCLAGRYSSAYGIDTFRVLVHDDQLLEVHMALFFAGREVGLEPVKPQQGTLSDSLSRGTRAQASGTGAVGYCGRPAYATLPQVADHVARHLADYLSIEFIAGS